MFKIAMVIVVLATGLGPAYAANSDSPLDEASALFRLRYDQKAMVALDKILNSAPSEEIARRARYMRGITHSRLSNTPEALTDLQTVASTKSTLAPLAKQALVKLYRTVGQGTRALELLESGVDFSQGQKELERARSLEAIGKNDEAISAWKTVVAIKKARGPYAEAYAALARLNKKIGKEREAKKYIKTLVIHWPHTPEGQAAAETLPPKGLSLANRRKRAERLWDVRLYDEAIVQMEGLLSSPKHRQWAQLMIGRLLSERLRERYPDAIVNFESCEAGPDRKLAGDCAYKKGIALGKVHNYDEAIITLRRFRTQFPENKNVLEAGFEIGRHLAENGQFDDAGAHLERWVNGARRLPDRVKYLWFAGWSYYRGKDYKNATRVFSELTSSRKTLVGDKALYWSGRAYYALGQRNKAVESLRKCVEGYPFGYYAWLAMRKLAAWRQPMNPPVSEFVSVRPGDENPMATIKKLPRSIQKKVEPVLDLVAVGEMKRATKRWERLVSLRGVLPAKVYDSLSKAMDILLERHYQVRKRAFQKYRRVRAEWPSQNSIDEWRAIFPRAFRKLAQVAAREENLPEWLLYAHMLQESRYGTQMISGAKALGVLQILPSTSRKIAKDIGIPYQEEWLFDAGYNIRQAAWYLGSLAKRFQGQLPLAIASYNGGPRLLSFIMTQYPNLEMEELIESMPTHQSRNYARKVIEHMHRYLAIYASKSERIRVMRSLFPRSLNRTEGPEPSY